MILYHVDDNQAAQKNMQDYLSSSDVDYFCFSEGKELMDALDLTPCDIIITGLELLDGPAMDFIQMINDSRHVLIPVIVLTSSNSMILREKLFSLGVVDYLIKSEVNDRRIKAYINALIQNGKLMEELKNIPIAVLDESHFIPKLIMKIFEFHHIRNVDYFMDSDTLLSTENNYAIYLLDMVSPGFEEEELVFKLRDRNSDSRIIAVTGQENCPMLANLLMSGADDFILKPFDYHLFMARLKANIRTYSMIQHLRIHKLG